MSVDIKIGELYDKPSGIKHTDGEGNAEQFREDVLYPSILLYGKVNVILEDDVHYASNWLIEAFVGLIRYNGMRKIDVIKNLTFSYHDVELEFYENVIMRYINEE